MKKSSRLKAQNSKVAFLWDESFLWGLMAYKTLKTNNLSFELIRSEDIRNGHLKNYEMLFVPGGWASNKLKALGTIGANEIKTFVNNGGNYLGFCGGAGLATLDGIGLLNIKRKPTKDRVPSFSGRIRLNINDHPIWQSVRKGHDLPIFHAWWPSQFLIKDKGIKILATYSDAMPDSFSSDLNIGDVEANGNWTELEDIYKINLNPKRLKNEPAVVEGNFGKGKVILSLIHFDTINDTNGAKVLKNLWEHLAGQSNRATEQQSSRTAEQQNIKGKIIPYENYCSTELLRCCTDIESAVDDLISFGIRNFLWFWRSAFFLQWRRGVRGLEYCTLYAIVKEIVELLKRQDILHITQNTDLHKTKELLKIFVEKAKQLILMERIAMQNGHITYERCDNPKIQEIRTELFGNSKSHGGMFKRLIDELDNSLYKLLKKEA